MGQLTPSIIATATVTLSIIVDIDSVTRYYCLTTSAPQAPTTNPPEERSATVTYRDDQFGNESIDTSTVDGYYGIHGSGITSLEELNQQTLRFMDFQLNFFDYHFPVEWMPVIDAYSEYFPWVVNGMTESELAETRELCGDTYVSSNMRGTFNEYETEKANTYDFAIWVLLSDNPVLGVTEGVYFTDYFFRAGDDAYDMGGVSLSFPGNWTTTEPTYTPGSTKTLYFTDCTIFTNGSFKYSEVSKSSSYEAAKDALNRVVEAETQIEQNKEQISLRATKTEVATAVQDIQVGGRNLIVQSDTVVGWVNSSGIVTADNGYRASGYIPVTPGETLMFQLWMPSSQRVWIDDTYFYDESKNYVGGYDGEYITTSHVVKKYTVPSNATYVRVSYSWGDSFKVKLEKGNKATDWTPAPEDMVDNDSFETYKTQAAADLTVTADAVKISVSKTITQETERLSQEIENGDKTLQTQLDEFRMNYDFTDDGQYIGKSDSNTKLHLSNDTMEILVGGSAVTTVNTEGFSADKLNVTALMIGDYALTITKSGRLRIT